MLLKDLSSNEIKTVASNFNINNSIDHAKKYIWLNVFGVLIGENWNIGQT